MPFVLNVIREMIFIKEYKVVAFYFWFSLKN